MKNKKKKKKKTYEQDRQNSYVVRTPINSLYISFQWRQWIVCLFIVDDDIDDNDDD